ncbi:MAG: glycosyltransferase family A protein [Gallionellaceae bacterium]|nr:glycosyltransferase family A protein [Gallionellaceae bacterium]
MRNRLVCIVNNYNYAHYLPQCLDSALRQGFDRIVVVDDGSGDGSQAIIETYAGKSASIIPIVKPNGGQLSCFNAAAKYVEEGDLVFFLDADDLLPRNYASEVARVAAQEKADFYFCEAVQFTDEQECPAEARISDAAHMVLPLTSALTLASQRWIGSPTSALAMTGALFRQIIPYPFVSDWRVRADDVLVYGASILGAKKVYVRSLGVGYRQHGSNLYAGNAKWTGPEQQSLLDFRRARLLRIFSARAGVRRYPGYAALKQELLLLDAAVQAYLRVDLNKLLRRSLRNKIKRMFLGDRA